MPLKGRQLPSNIFLKISHGASILSQSGNKSDSGIQIFKNLYVYLSKYFKLIKTETFLPGNRLLENENWQTCSTPKGTKIKQ